MGNYVVKSSDGTATVFNRTDKDADNEAAANEFLAERQAAAPWLDHEVMTEADFKDASDAEVNASDEETADPGSGDATDTEH